MGTVHAVLCSQGELDWKDVAASLSTLILMYVYMTWIKYRFHFLLKNYYVVVCS